MGTSTFSNYTVVPEIALAKVNEKAPFDKICYIGCGVTTGIGAVMNTAQATAGCNAVVFGLGGIGLNVIQGLRMIGANMIVGVESGFSKSLEIIGVGSRAQVKGTTLVVSAGYSHPVEVAAPDGITFKVENNTKVTVSGIDKELVGNEAAKIRSIRPPEPYKGKGIRYEGEWILRKAGKSGKK